MSSRSSIVYTKHFHIYHECNYEQICVEFTPSGELNEAYEDPVITAEELVEMYLELEENLAYRVGKELVEQCRAKRAQEKEKRWAELIRPYTLDEA